MTSQSSSKPIKEAAWQAHDIRIYDNTQQTLPLLGELMDYIV